MWMKIGVPLLVYLALTLVSKVKLEKALEDKEHLLILLPGMDTLPFSQQVAIKTIKNFVYLPFVHMLLFKPIKYLNKLAGLSEARLSALSHKQAMLSQEEYIEEFKKELDKGPSPVYSVDVPEETTYKQIDEVSEEELMGLFLALLPKEDGTK